MAGAWEHFEHEADMGLRGIGDTPAEAFEQAAVAMTAVITEPEKVAAERAVEITCKGGDLELLLVDWLNELVYEMATRHWLFGRFEVTIDGEDLVATAWGEPLDIARHDPAVEVKGATYTMLAVRQREDGRWVAECVVDV